MNPFNLKNQIFLRFSEIFFSDSSTYFFLSSETPIIPVPDALDKVSKYLTFYFIISILCVTILGRGAFLPFDLPNH